jgi:hypothetical protein
MADTSIKDLPHAILGVIVALLKPKHKGALRLTCKACLDGVDASITKIKVKVTAGGQLFRRLTALKHLTLAGGIIGGREGAPWAALARGTPHLER